jgi:hypothetical protein
MKFYIYFLIALALQQYFNISFNVRQHEYTGHGRSFDSNYNEDKKTTF